MFRTPHEASVRRALRAAVVCLGFVLGIACVPLTMGNTGCATSPVLKGPGEPCTRTSECQSALTCTSGVCRAEPGVDASVTRDAGHDARTLPTDGGGSLDAATEDAPAEDAPIADDAPVDDAAPIDDAAIADDAR